MGDQKKSKKNDIYEVRDENMRNFLITAAIGVEKQFRAGVRIAFTEYVSTSKKLPPWMMCSYKIEPRGDDTAELITLSLWVNPTKLYNWMLTNSWLWNGIFSAALECGVSMLYVKKEAKNFRKMDFFLHDDSGKHKVLLPLMDKKISFQVHRKQYSPNEWAIHFEL